MNNESKDVREEKTGTFRISPHGAGATSMSEIQSRLLLPMHPDKNHCLGIEFTVLQ
jgi:hypothetical protein